MNKLFAILLLCASFGAGAQTTTQINDPKAKERVLNAEFSSVSVSSGIQLFLTQGDKVALAVSASEERFEERFKTEVVKGVLKIYYDASGLSGNNYKNRKLIAYLSVKDINSIKTAAGSTVRLVNPLKVNDLSIDCSSGSLLSGTVDLSSLKATANSGAQLTLDGKSDNVDVSVNSGAIFKGGGLASQYCRAHANSGAAIKIAVEKEIKASANSGGSIAYQGDALLKKGTINSGGVVKKVK